MERTTERRSLHRRRVFGQIQPANAIRRKKGVTLIELLIVVGLLTILATVALTSVKGLLKDQKVTSAARLVQQYFETAKVRAITSGRPVAVFLDRITLEDDGAGGNLPGNYSTNRLSLGDVKPPYSGDVVDATGVLWDIDATVAQSGGTPTCIARPSDSYADQIRFSVIDVVTGFGTQGGTPGFVERGDLIEFEGSNRQFEIEDIRFVPTTSGLTEVAVTFFNPPAPATYNGLLAANGLAPDPNNLMFLCPYYSTINPGMPLRSGVALAGIDADTPDTTPLPIQRTKFRIYRRPVKSLVGAVTLPRGTCIDLFVSGPGLTGTANDGAIVSPFYTLPPASKVGGSVEPLSYSRVGVLFDRTGKPSGMFIDEKLVGTTTTLENFQQFTLDSKLYLMVGRTDQVIATDTVIKPAPEDRESILPNVLDPANSWISINPVTGLVSTVPVAAVSSGIANGASRNLAAVVRESRALAAVGVNNGGQ
ncbi:MAG: Tfp pilus assembly protein FimT/FimU [Pirellulaceae bacterium]